MVFFLETGLCENAEFLFDQHLFSDVLFHNNLQVPLVFISSSLDFLQK